MPVPKPPLFDVISSRVLTFLRSASTPQAYAVCAGVLVLVIDMIFQLTVDGWGYLHLFEAVVIGFVCWGAVLGAFRLARNASLREASRLADGMQEGLRTGALPVMPSHGWSLFDQVHDGMQELLALRNARIASLQQDVEYYRQLAEEMPGLELVFGQDGRLRWVNPAMQVLTGFTHNECLTAPDPVELWGYAKDRGALREMMSNALQGKAQEGVELRMQRKDHSVFWCSCRCYPLHDKAGNISGLRFSAQDIQPRKDADLKLLETVAELRRAQALKEHYLGRSNDERMRLTALLETVSLGILFVDRDRRVVYINQTCADMWQLGERSEVIGMRDDVLLQKTAPLRIDTDAYQQHVEDVIAQRDKGKGAHYDIHFVDGRVLREHSSVVPAADGGRLIGRVWIYEDITEALRAQEQLIELAERDSLTNLYNRRRFHEDLARQLAETARRGDALGLILFDLDGFKDINDSFGHHAGDHVLQRVASELSQVTRRHELLFRLGGDEFAILAVQPSTDSLTHLAGRVVSKVASLSFEFDGLVASVTISLGIAMTPVNGHDAEALIHAADQAMYRAKHEGKNRWVMATRA
jgi:diguanylate cyclase